MACKRKKRTGVSSAPLGVGRGCGSSGNLPRGRTHRGGLEREKYQQTTSARNACCGSQLSSGEAQPGRRSGKGAAAGYSQASTALMVSALSGWMLANPPLTARGRRKGPWSASAVPPSAQTDIARKSRRRRVAVASPAPGSAPTPPSSLLPLECAVVTLCGRKGVGEEGVTDRTTSWTRRRCSR